MLSEVCAWLQREGINRFCGGEIVMVVGGTGADGVGWSRWELAIEAAEGKLGDNSRREMEC